MTALPDTALLSPVSAVVRMLEPMLLIFVCSSAIRS